MMNFNPITIKNMEEIQSHLQRANSPFCDHCFVDIFIWKDHFKTHFCILDDILFLKTEAFPTGTPIYIAPIGPSDFIKAVPYIHEDARQRSVPFIMTSLTLGQKKILEETFPDEFSFEELRNSADYIYSSSDLISLKGSKFHSKRNFINRFKKVFENRWVYENITPDNREEVLRYYDEWRLKQVEKGQDFFQGEYAAVRLALENFEALGLLGGLLRLDGRIIAFTFGVQSSNEMFTIQVEKAHSDIPGAYQMINQQFVIANCQEVRWINREEDLGLEGLRKAKLSYHPAVLAMKYKAVSRIEVGQKHVYSLC